MSESNVPANHLQPPQAIIRRPEADFVLPVAKHGNALDHNRVRTVFTTITICYHLART